MIKFNQTNELKFKELKVLYRNQIVTDNQFHVIEENEYVIKIENNGISGLYPNKIWYTAYGLNKQEFDFYY